MNKHCRGYTRRVRWCAVLAAFCSAMYGATNVLACSAVQPCTSACQNNYYVGGTQSGTATISGGEAHIDTWNPSPVWGDSSAWIMTDVNVPGNTPFDYAQVGEDHPNVGYGGNVEVFFEYRPDSGGAPISFYPMTIPSGNVDYQVYRDWREGGMIFQAGSLVYHQTDANWNPTEIESAAEIWDYETVPGSTSHGDAAMGDKSNHVFTNSVSWSDAAYGNHWANLNYSVSPHADYQASAHSNSNNWSTWDNRCG